MEEINVIGNLSRIKFSREQPESVAKVLAVLIADGVNREVNARVSAKQAANDTIIEPARAEEPKRKKK